MAVWYSFVCESCGHGGLTQDRYSYENGSQPCTQCGSIEFTVDEPDTVGYPELDEREAGGGSR